MFQIPCVSMAPVPGASYPHPTRAGSAIADLALNFSASATQAAQASFILLGYTSGDFDISVFWHPDTSTSTSEDVAWGISLAVVNPNTTTTSMESLSWGTETILTDTVLGTTAERPHVATGTITPPTVADGYIVFVRLRRVHDHGSDDMTGYAQAEHLLLEWS